MTTLIILCTDQIVVAWIKLSDRQAVDFSNEADQVVRIFIYYSIERSSEKIYADQTSNSFNRREDLLERLQLRVFSTAPWEKLSDSLAFKPAS